MPRRPIFIALNAVFVLVVIAVVAVVAAGAAGTVLAQDLPLPTDPSPDPSPSPDAPDRSLAVAVREVPPFAMKDRAGNWEGISVDLWQDVADKAGFSFDWKELPLGATLEGLESGTVDVGVPALTITPEREQRIDFTHPYFVGGLGLGYRGDRESGLLATARGLFSKDFLSVVASLMAVLLLAGAAVWIFERRGNNEEFQKGSRGLGDGFWWSAVTMTTVGYGDKSPRTLGGRIVALIWMFASMIIIAGFTASIAASLTAHRLGDDLLKDRALNQLKVAVLQGSNGDGFATEQGAKVQRHPSLEEALAAVRERRADVVLHDAPILRYRAQQDGVDWLEVSQGVLVREDYGFGLRSGSPYRETINTTLLSILLEPAWQNLRRRYLGETDEW